MKFVKSFSAVTSSLCCLALGFAAQASIVNTGVDANNDGIDDNWTLVSGTAYVAVPPGLPADTFPLQPNGPWLANTPVSSWITDAKPIDNGGSALATFDYQLSFSSVGETIGVRWLSDNESTLWLDGVGTGTKIGTRPDPIGQYDPSTFSSWNTYISVALSSGSHTFDIVVVNDPQDSGNPTGARFEAVPEPTTLIAGALLLLPFGASTLRLLRKNRKA